MGLSCEEKSKKKSAGNNRQINDGTLQPDQAVASNGKFRVLVVDDGFDTSLPVFQGKILDSYTLQCDEAKKEELRNRQYQSYEAMKADHMALLNDQQGICQINKGVQLDKSPRFQEIATYRSAWNANFSASGVNPYGDTGGAPGPGLTQQAAETIQSVIMGEGTRNYHGTYVAGLIAYNNPNVELVLINITLATGDPVDSCQTQQKIDWETRLYRDPEYLIAAKNAPLSAVEKNLYSIVRQYNFDLVNASFGTPATVEIEKSLAEKGCGQLNLKEYTAAYNEHVNAVYLHQKQRGDFPTKALTIMAFGNESAPINTMSDGDGCAQLDTVTVASSDINGRVADFSNYGQCADVFVPGKEIVVVTPDNFIVPADGTSFSSPLFVRYITLNYPLANSYDNILKQYYRTGQFIPVQNFPNELLYERIQGTVGFSLTGRQPKIQVQRLPIRLPFRFRN